MSRSGALAIGAVLIALVLSACDGGETNPTIPPTEAPPPTSDTTTTTETPGTTEVTVVTTATTSTTTTSTTEPPGPRTIQIDYEDGVTTDTVQVEVELGSRVIIVVTADVEDDVVVPGYSVSADVGPSSAAIIEFDANVPGTFEVELEDANKVLVEIEVG